MSDLEPSLPKSPEQQRIERPTPASSYDPRLLRLIGRTPVRMVAVAGLMAAMYMIPAGRSSAASEGPSEETAEVDSNKSVPDSDGRSLLNGIPIDASAVSNPRVVAALAECEFMERFKVELNDRDDEATLTLKGEDAQTYDICGVQIKAGNQTIQRTSNGKVGDCYTVSGIGTDSAKVEELKEDDPNCKDISNVIFGVEKDEEATATPTKSPTPTNTSTPVNTSTPTATLTAVASNTPTNTATVVESATPTSTGTTTEATPTATATATQPEATPTGTAENPTPTTTGTPVETATVLPTATGTITFTPTATSTRGPEGDDDDDDDDDDDNENEGDDDDDNENEGDDDDDTRRPEESQQGLQATSTPVPGAPETIQVSQPEGEGEEEQPQQQPGAPQPVPPFMPPAGPVPINQPIPQPMPTVTITPSLPPGGPAPVQAPFEQPAPAAAPAQVPK
jgi:hypothetical protein